MATVTPTRILSQTQLKWVPSLSDVDVTRLALLDQQSVMPIDGEAPTEQPALHSGDAAIDELLRSPLSTMIPLLPAELYELPDAPSLSETVVPTSTDSIEKEVDRPMFTALEAELLLASLEDPKVEGPSGSGADVDTAAKKRPNVSSRKRQQQEMEYLREQVVELETALGRLKEEQSESTTLTTAAQGSGALWEQIAKRQMEEKRRAEVENIKLRTLLEGQLRVAHSLEKLLTKRALTDTEPLLDVSKRPRVSELLPAADVQPSSSQLDDQLAEIDGVMVDSGLAHVETEIDECQIKTDDQNEIFLERTMSKLLPFPLHQAGDAAWRRLTPSRMDLSNGFYGTTRKSESDYDVEFSVMTKVRRATAQCLGKGAGRRKRLPGKRDAMAWQIRAVLQGSPFPDHSVGMLDCGYLVVEPITTASGKVSSILKACVRIWPQLAASELDKTGLFVDLTLSSFNQNTKTILQLIENDLLEESLGSNA